MQNYTKKVTNPETGYIAENTYSETGTLTRSAVYDSVEFGGKLISQTTYPKGDAMPFTLENLREKWLPILQLRGQDIKEAYLDQYQEDVNLYKFLNPGDAWRNINLNNL